MSLSLPTQFYCGRRAGTRRSCRRRGEHADLYRYLKASIREAAKSAGCELTSIAAPSGLRERSIVRRSRLTKERRETGTQLVYARRKRTAVIIFELVTTIIRTFSAADAHFRRCRENGKSPRRHDSPVAHFEIVSPQQWSMHISCPLVYKRAHMHMSVHTRRCPDTRMCAVGSCAHMRMCAFETSFAGI
ncbi:unnamed protein product, partial [Iphiclides podalirius]